MDHTGDEAVPRAVSLFEAHLNQPSRVALLQRRDGYDSDHLEVGAELPEGYEPPLNVLAELLGQHARRSRSCAEDEIALLARTARPQLFGPMERIIVQGQAGRLAVRGRRRDGRGPAAALETAPTSTSARAPTPCWARCRC